MGGRPPLKAGHWEPNEHRGSSNDTAAHGYDSHGHFLTEKELILYSVSTEPSAGSRKQITEAELKRSLYESEIESVLSTRLLRFIFAYHTAG